MRTSIRRARYEARCGDTLRELKSLQFDLKIPKGKSIDVVNGIGDLANDRMRDVTVVNTGEGFPRQGTLMANLFH